MPTGFLARNLHCGRLPPAYDRRCSRPRSGRCGSSPPSAPPVPWLPRETFGDPWFSPFRRVLRGRLPAPPFNRARELSAVDEVLLVFYLVDLFVRIVRVVVKLVGPVTVIPQD